MIFNSDDFTEQIADRMYAKFCIKESKKKFRNDVIDFITRYKDEIVDIVKANPTHTLCTYNNKSFNEEFTKLLTCDGVDTYGLNNIQAQEIVFDILRENHMGCTLYKGGLGNRIVTQVIDIDCAAIIDEFINR